MINQRCERNSILLTIHKAFKDWNTVFPNATCIAALLDRLRSSNLTKFHCLKMVQRERVPGRTSRGKPLRRCPLGVRAGLKEHQFCRFSGQQSSVSLEAGHTPWLAAENNAQSSRVEFSPYDFGQAKR